MRWVSYFVRRAVANMTREPMLTGATVLTLATVFLCFCAFLAVALGLTRVVRQWASDFHVSVYLKAGVPADEASRVAAVLAELPQVARADVIRPSTLRRNLAASFGNDQALASLSPRLFPMTVELQLSRQVRDANTLALLGERLAGLSVVDQVETYGDLFARLRVVSVVAHAVSLVLGLIVLVATLLVVSNTIRLSLLGRREEIEIMKLCGATDRFVKAPFIVAGALQGLLGAVTALALLALASFVLERAIGTFLPAFVARSMVGLPPLVILLVTLGGTLLGVAGSHFSVHRFLQEAP